ncbi:MAG: energy-coupling factor transporter ATPase [Clostridium sp.]|nr:energy-coupling factor transporter ATPase [Clostridium sp.]
MSIVTKELTHVYMEGTPFEKKALDNINIDIKTGEFVGIIGSTGSGKSTLIQHFNGLLKPTTGNVYINGKKLKSKGNNRLQESVGIVFQYPEHQLFEETVYKDIAFGLKKRREKKDEIDTKIRSIIKMVGLSEDTLEKSPFELSGGEKRRVAMAGILVLEPEILVLDEPAAGLDPNGRNEIFDMVSKLHREFKRTVILVSHSMDDVAKYVDNVIVMEEGKVQMSGTAKDIFDDIKKLEQIGLTVPQITALMKKLKKIIPSISDKIITVDEAYQELIKYLKKP